MLVKKYSAVTVCAEDAGIGKPNWKTLSARQADIVCTSALPPVSEAVRMLRGVVLLLACEPAVDTGDEPRRREPTVCWECVEELDDIVRWRDNDWDIGGGPACAQTNKAI